MKLIIASEFGSTEHWKHSGSRDCQPGKAGTHSGPRLSEAPSARKKISARTTARQAGEKRNETPNFSHGCSRNKRLTIS